jgi:hypothetical protein
MYMSVPGLPDFSLYMIPKPEKITKLTENILKVKKYFKYPLKF